MAHQQHGVFAFLVVLPYLAQDGIPAARVQARCGLIQYQHLGIHGQHPGNGHPALLPAGKLKGAFFHHVLRKAHKAQRLPHPLFHFPGGQPHIGGAEGHIRRHRLAKELVLRVLEHQPHLEAEPPQVLFIGPQVLAVNVDLALGGSQQAIEVLDEGGLAGAGMPDDPSKLPLLYLDVEILQGGPLIGGALRINMR